MNDASPPTSAEPRLFTLTRNDDETGISGVGRVLDGVVFHNGKVVACWRSDLRGGFSSLAVYDSWEAFRAIHIDPHPPSQTTVIFAPAPSFPDELGTADS
jgi:hypothetical protein